MTRKNKLQANILEYKRRRAQLRKQYPNWGSKWPEHQQEVKEYAAKARVLNERMKIWRQRIKRIERDEVKIWAANDLVCSFLELPTLRNMGGRLEHRYRTAKKLFCKYAIESGVTGGRLADFLKCHPSVPSTARLKFTRSFISSKEHYQLWQQFKNYIKEYGAEQKIAA